MASRVPQHTDTPPRSVEPRVAAAKAAALEQRARENAKCEQHQRDLRRRRDDRDRRIETLLDRARRFAAGTLPHDEELFLWFLLRRPAEDWLPPSDWPRPPREDADEPEELAAWRTIVLDRRLRNWRPKALDPEVTSELMRARPWEKRDGAPGTTFTAAAWVFHLVLASRGDALSPEALALVHDLAAYAMTWGAAGRPLGEGAKAKAVRSRLKPNAPRPRDLERARARLIHARRMFDWFAEGLAEAAATPAGCHPDPTAPKR